MYLIKDDTNNSFVELNISDKEFTESNIQDTYIGGVQLIKYDSPEDEKIASNWKAESSLKNRQLSLTVTEVLSFICSFFLFTCGALLLGLGMNQAGSFALISGAFLMGLTEVLAYIRKYQINTERRTKKIEESQEKLIKHFSLLTTGSFEKIYEKYRDTALASNSKLEALVRAHLLMPSEAIILNKLFETHFDPEMATQEERIQLEVAKATFSVLQADLAIAQRNPAPVFERTEEKPHTDTSDWPLVL